MGAILAAAPYEEFIRRNIPVISAIFFLLLALLVVRMVIKTMTRIILLALIVLLISFVYLERANITDCAETCDCKIAGANVELPACDPNVIR